MPFLELHPWDVPISEAAAIQRSLRSKVVCTDEFARIRTVAGIDVGVNRKNNMATAAVVVLRYPELTLIEQVVSQREVVFPYLPGYLSFREVPVILDALSQLGDFPDILLCDAHGLAHPRRFGLACHLGIWCDLPSIGVAKSPLVGEFHSPSNAPGSWEPVIDGDEIIGAALRTRSGVKPVFVSIGHKISLPSALNIVMQCSPKYRIPEPIRQAHHLASGER